MKHAVPEEIIYNFGNGPIRYCENDIYYHGVGTNEDIWNKDNKLDKCFLFIIVEEKNYLEKI